MKHIYQANIKPFLREQITKAAKEKRLTKEEAAELLGIDARSYAYLKAGKNMCSASTLLLFLTKMCPDTEEFIREATKVVDEAEENVVF